MNALLLAAALALPAGAETQTPQPANTVQDQAGELKTSPWGNTGGDAGSARGAAKASREVQASAVIGIVAIGAGLFVLAERHRIRRFDNPGGTEHPHEGRFYR